MSIEEPVEVCLMNIGARGQRRRRNMGYVTAFLAAVATAVVLLYVHDRVWRILMYPVFSAPAMYFFQARAKT